MGGKLMAQDESRDTRRELVELLLGKIEADPYPSTTMLRLVEELLTPEEVQAYADILMDKAQSENFPSIPMLARVRTVIEDRSRG
jgi:hypothetical protein